MPLYLMSHPNSSLNASFSKLLELANSFLDSDNTAIQETYYEYFNRIERPEILFSIFS